MFLPVYLAAMAAIVFYALLPVVGAFAVRQQWRLFRRAVTDAARLPALGPGNAPGDSPRAFRAQGEVDAIGGASELWVSGGGSAYVVDLRDAWVYVLTGRSGDDRIERRRWSGLPSISPGARAFIAGYATLSGGRIVFGPSGRDAPLVILHDGDDERLVRRAVWAGRHENEYWNPVTQISLALGAAVMSYIVSLALPGKMPSLIGALTITAAFSPVLPLMPPGVVGFFLYRRYWRKARYCRARRDTEPLDGEAKDATVSWRRRAYEATAASVLAFASALAVNGWLLIVFLRRYL